MKIRCKSRIHGDVESGRGTIKVVCQSKHCGNKAGMTVLHTFNLETGELLSTRKFQTPQPTGV